MDDNDTLWGTVLKLLNRSKRTAKRTAKISPNRAAQIQKGFVLFNGLVNGIRISVHRFSVQRSGLPFYWVHRIRVHHCPTDGKRASACDELSRVAAGNSNLI